MHILCESRDRIRTDEYNGQDMPMGGIKIGQMILGPVQTNTYYIYREPEGEERTSSGGGTDPGSGGAGIPVILIDPADAGEQIYDTLRGRGFVIVYILLTHGHFDHIGGIPGIQARAAADGALRIPVACLDTGRPLCGDADLNCSLSMGGRGIAIEPDALLGDGQMITAAGLSCRVIATPGHTADGCSYYCEEAGILFSGDTLFSGSVGRTDLPTGDMGTLLRSVREKLLALPDETVVLPGHGEETTIGDE